MRGTSLSLAGVLLVSSFAVWPAFAAGPLHSKQQDSFSVDDPAGTVCDFNLHSAWTFDQNWKDFSTNGEVVRSIRNEALTIEYRNVDTGETLSESDHYKWDINWVTGVFKFSGINSKLRDEDGRLVFVWAGRFVFDAFQGVFLSYTNVPPDFAQTICPLLGGEAVPQ
jgi:hypothetical protein